VAHQLATKEEASLYPADQAVPGRQIEDDNPVAEMQPPSTKLAPVLPVIQRMSHLRGGSSNPGRKVMFHGG